MSFRIHIHAPNLMIAVNRMDWLASQIPGVTNHTLKALAEQILKDSDTLSPTVPDSTGRPWRADGKTGSLRSTGRVEQVRDARGQFGAAYAILYGGQAKNGVFVDYAEKVHDDLRPRNYTRPGSGPKFVEAHYLRRTADGGRGFSDALQALVTTAFRGV